MTGEPGYDAKSAGATAAATPGKPRPRRGPAGGELGCDPNSAICKPGYDVDLGDLQAQLERSADQPKSRAGSLIREPR